MTSWFSKKIFHLLGWSLVGQYPAHIKKKVLIVAPHTSGWDIGVGFLIKWWLKIDAHFYGKVELFKGLMGWFLRLLGGLPVDRSKSNNLVQQIVEDFNRNDEYTIVLTPEGTRRKVDSFKSGFYFIAKQSGAAIIPIAFDYANKRVIIMSPYYPKGPAEKEIAEIEDMFRGISGKIPSQSFG